MRFSHRPTPKAEAYPEPSYGAIDGLVQCLAVMLLLITFGLLMTGKLLAVLVIVGVVTLIHLSRL